MEERLKMTEIEAVEYLLKAEKNLHSALFFLKRCKSPLVDKVEQIHKQLIPFREAYQHQMEAIVRSEAYQPESSHPEGKSSHT